MLRKIQALLFEETYGFNFRWQLAQLMMAFIPRYTGGRVRTRIMRMLGFNVGLNTMIWDTPRLVGDRYLHNKISIGKNCLITIDTYWDLAAPICIGNAVGFSPQTMILTGSHDMGHPKNRVGRMVPRPVVIGDGVWLGARCTILPGVNIGEGAVVGAGALVTQDVLPHTLVAGVPAKWIRDLPKDE